MTMQFIKPMALAPGDRIGVFLPASPIKEPFRSQGLAALEKMGFQPVEVVDPLSSNGFAARTPAQAQADMRRFLQDKTIKALWAGRGGYGSNYLLESLTGLDPKQAKIVIGSSDVSYLLWGLLERLHWVVFYGPMVCSTMADGRFDAPSLIHNLTGAGDNQVIPATVLRPGRCRGILTGGCLSNFVSLLGTPWCPETNGRLLLLEDVNEKPYRLDRMVWQLSQSGILQGIAGLILGTFPGCFREPAERTDFLAMVERVCAGSDFPILVDAPLGHGDTCHTVPLGVQAEIDSSGPAGLVIQENGVRT
jgi:muramoyltetrapeptide carboxypeptidase